MKLIVVKIIALVLILICVDSKLSYELTEANMAKYWDNIQKQLNLLQQFNCTGKGLTEDSLAKILSLEFPHLNRLSFYIDFPKDTNVFLTPKLIKLVFTSNYFPHLKILNLKNTNIDNRYFQFLDESHQLISNLTYLNLHNLISRKGFESLAKIDFQGKLTYLLIDNNLLIQSKAVSSVKSIICRYQNNICQTSLKYLSISSTEIQRESFINLITTINSTQLQVLFMDSLTLIYYNQYNNGTNYTAFEALSKLNLPNLKRISLVGSLIDDNIAKIFENWTLPQLTHLDISQNQISDKGIKIWINKKNMPSLNFLLMRGTLMGDQSLLHFSTQNYQFKTLSIGDCQLSRKGHSNLSLLDTSQLQSLYFYDININSKQIQKFLETNATKLTSLHFINSNDLKDIFTLMPWDNLPALKQLQFRDCDLFKSYTSMLLLLKTQKLLQNIKILKLFQTQIKNINLFNKVLITISKVMPNLQQLIIYEFNKKFQSFLIIELLDELQFKNKILIETGLITLYKIPNKKYEIIKLLQPVILFLTKNFQKENRLSLDDIQKNIPEMSQKYQFGKLRQLKLDSREQSDILFKIFEKLNITLLQSLTTLELRFPMEIDDFLDALSQFTFPKLQILSLNIIIPDNADIQQSIKKLTNFLKRIKTLYQMSFDFEMLNELNTNDKRKKILQSFYFPFLISMKTQDQQIQLKQMSQFIKNHNQTLRKLIISNSFSQQGLFSLLSSSNIILRNLDISSIQFPIKQFSIFGLVNTQFIDTFIADSAGLTDQHIIQMIDKKMQDKTGVFMPNLQRIDFQKNSIKQDGLKKWFSTGIHNLKILLIQQNNNPKYINQLLRYPNKISILIAVNIEIYEIENNIHKDAAKYIKQVQLQTESLVGTDFQNLAKMDFIKLDRIILLLNQIYDCQVLKSILKIVKEASALQLIFKNEKRGLNSSCLKDFQFQSKIQTIVIIDQYRTILIPEFINLLFNSDNQIKIIVFKELNLPKQTIQKIFSSQLQELNTIRFDGIEIGDNMIDLLMKNKFAVLQQLTIMNAYLTSKSLQKLINKPQPYQELQIMILNGNDFSQEIDISFKSLQSSQFLLLSLDQCDLPPSFLKALNSAQLAQLQALSLNYNSFSGDDIFQFISDIQRKSLMSLTDILLNGHELNKTQYQNIMQVTESKRIRLELDEPRYLPKKNHASYA